MSAAFDQGDTARVLEELVQIRSLSRDEGAAARYLVGALGNRGFRSHVDAAGNAVGVIGHGKRTIALVGHIDTVPGDLPVHVTDGVLHGRGSVDAKGSLVTLCSAARRAVDAGIDGRFVVVGCVEEEAESSKGAQYLADTWTAAPEALVIGEPSGADGVTLGYKGILSGRVDVACDSAHGAHEAKSAPELGCDVWQRIAEDAAAFAPEGATLFDSILPRLRSMGSSHDGVVDTANLHLALRLPPSLTPGDAEAWVRERVAAVAEDATFTALGRAAAWRGPRTSTIARALGREILRTGVKPRFQVKTGTADLNVLAPAWGCPAVAYGPGDAALDHTPEERVSLAEVEIAAETLGRALASLLPQAVEGHGAHDDRADQDLLDVVGNA